MTSFRLSRRVLMVSAASAALTGLVARLAPARAGQIGQAGPVIKARVGAVRASTVSGGPPEPARAGASLPADVIIQTPPKAAADIVMPDGAKVRVGANTTVRIVSQAGQDGKPQSAAIAMTQGAVRYASGRLPSQSVALETRSARVTLKGTAFSLQDRGEKTTACSTFSGAIVCTSKATGLELEVPAGQSAIWDSGSFGDGLIDGALPADDPAIDADLADAAAEWGEELDGEEFADMEPEPGGEEPLPEEAPEEAPDESEQTEDPAGETQQDEPAEPERPE